jgi:hypothetical protein
MSDPIGRSPDERGSGSPSITRADQKALRSLKKIPITIGATPGSRAANEAITPVTVP